MMSSERKLFEEQGFLVKQIKIDDEVADRIIQHVWSLFPSSFSRGNPGSWQGAFTDSCRTQTIHKRRGHTKFREILRKENWIGDLILDNPEIHESIKNILGENEIPTPEYVRGVYPIFPAPLQPSEIRPHIDSHIFSVGVVVYLNDVRESGGGFTVWPGSHKLLRFAFLGKHGAFPLFFHKLLLRIVGRKIGPTEISGERGTVIFWDRRLGHASGTNHLDEIRFATLGDFRSQSAEKSARRAKFVKKHVRKVKTAMLTSFARRKRSFETVS